jgi:hypothetical protein
LLRTVSIARTALLAIFKAREVVADLSLEASLSSFDISVCNIAAIVSENYSI